MRDRLFAPVLSASAAFALVVSLGTATSLAQPDAAAAAVSATGGGRAASGGTWGNAEEVPGSAALNAGGAAEVRSLSCGSAGNCSAGGNIQNSAASGRAWVVSERNSTWGSAREVAVALTTGSAAQINSLSCPSANNCGGGGMYTNRAGQLRAFVINEVKGTWDRARQVAAALNTGGNAQIYTVSCGPAGNCAAGGYYHRSGHYQAFIVTENKGKWGAAKEVAAALNTGGNATVESVSCSSAGNCAAAGQYLDRSRHTQAFLSTEVRGRWRSAAKVAVPGKDATATIQSVSCPARGNCSAGGYYRDGSGPYQALMVTERNGKWEAARRVPGTAALNTGGNASLGSVSCASAGNCAAAGQYLDRFRHTQVFVVSEVHGRWGKAKEVPGTAALNAGGFAQMMVSCPSAGNCSGAGSYADVPGQPHHWQVFVVDEAHGTWGKAQEIPGTAALNQGGNATASLSCASATQCSAGGYYRDAHSSQQVFVVNKS